MMTILLIIIYIAFIGLGIPDSLFGTAWPAIYQEFGLPISSANYVTLLISGGTLISSLFAAKIINRFGTAKVTVISTAMTAAALFGFSCSRNLFWLCLSAIPLGLGAGAIDSALNNYVALYYKAVHMNFLHCFYGIGVSLSPYLMSFSLSYNANWRKGYRIVFCLQFMIALITIFSLPLWNKIKDSSLEREQKTPRTINIFELLKIPAIRSVCFVFLGSCAIEYTAGIWGATFLVRTKGMDVNYAAKMITFYYIGIALGRFLSGIFANKLTRWQLVKSGQCIIAAAIIVLLFPLPPIISAFSLFMIGMVNARIFLNMLHIILLNFGVDISQSVIGIEMAASYTGIILAPTFFGLIAQNISIVLFSYYLLILFIIMIRATWMLKQKLKIAGKI